MSFLEEEVSSVHLRVEDREEGSPYQAQVQIHQSH